jgi:hypothetical protein
MCVNSEGRSGGPGPALRVADPGRVSTVLPSWSGEPQRRASPIKRISLVLNMIRHRVASYGHLAGSCPTL